MALEREKQSLERQLISSSNGGTGLSYVQGMGFGAEIWDALSPIKLGLYCSEGASVNCCLCIQCRCCASLVLRAEGLPTDTLCA